MVSASIAKRAADACDPALVLCYTDDSQPLSEQCASTAMHVHVHVHGSASTLFGQWL